MLREAGTRQCGGSLKILGLSIDFYGMLGRGAQTENNGYFSLTQSSQHERGRLPGLIQPFLDQMRRGNVHVNASRMAFKNVYARFHTFHRMGASQERAAFFYKLQKILFARFLQGVLFLHVLAPRGAWLRQKSCRPKIHPVLTRFALFLSFRKKACKNPVKDFC